LLSVFIQSASKRTGFHRVVITQYLLMQIHKLDPAAMSVEQQQQMMDENYGGGDYNGDDTLWYSKVRYYGLTLVVAVFLWSLGRFFLTITWNRISDAKYRAAAQGENIVVDPHNNGVVYPVSYFSDRGKRDYQEDAHQEMKGKGAADSSLYGVFDGHGGYRASHFCTEYLMKFVVEDTNFEQSPASALRRSFFKADAEFSAMAKMRMLSDGTTSLVACIHNRRLYVANAGDCRAVLITQDWKSIAMSVDHKPNREDEERRIKKLGGKVVHWGRWRVQGVLAVSRAIGDVSLQPYVTCEPEIQERALVDGEGGDCFLVLASDGIWDVMTNDDAAAVVKQAYKTKPFVDIAKELCAQAIALGSADNVTAQVVDVRRRG
jgi:protein phosphatase 1L